MEVEYAHRAIAVDENFQAEVEKLSAEGWQLLPGATPIALYHLVRAKAQPATAPGVKGRLIIDDSKVFIIPAKATQ